MLPVTPLSHLSALLQVMLFDVSSPATCCAFLRSRDLEAPFLSARHSLQCKMQPNGPILEMEVTRQLQKIILLPGNRGSHWEKYNEIFVRGPPCGAEGTSFALSVWWWVGRGSRHTPGRRHPDQLRGHGGGKGAACWKCCWHPGGSVTVRVQTPESLGSRQEQLSPFYRGEDRGQRAGHSPRSPVQVTGMGVHTCNCGPTTRQLCDLCFKPQLQTGDSCCRDRRWRHQNRTRPLVSTQLCWLLLFHLTSGTRNLPFPWRCPLDRYSLQSQKEAPTARGPTWLFAGSGGSLSVVSRLGSLMWLGVPLKTFSFLSLTQPLDLEGAEGIIFFNVWAIFLYFKWSHRAYSYSASY